MSIGERGLTVGAILAVTLGSTWIALYGEEEQSSGSEAEVFLQERRSINRELAGIELAVLEEGASGLEWMNRLSEWRENNAVRIGEQRRRHERVRASQQINQAARPAPSTPDEAEIYALDDEISAVWQRLIAGAETAEDVVVAQEEMGRWRAENPDKMARKKELAEALSQAAWREIAPIEVIVPSNPTPDERRIGDLQQELAQKYLQLRVDHPELSQVEFMDVISGNRPFFESKMAEVRDISKRVRLERLRAMTQN